MKKIQLCPTSIVGKLQSLGSMFDPEILQWPGGTFIALLLLFYATVSLALGFGRAARAQTA
jgi:hypothetical protein